jgi:metal-sulfur cluster biosynthetic enzyme
MENVEEVEIQLVWTPPWDPRSMATDDVKMMLGIWE